jgi:hypothetical protein
MINLTSLVFHLKSPSADPATIRLGIAIDILRLFPDELKGDSELSPEKLASRIGHLASLLDEKGAKAREIEKRYG